MRAMQFLFDSIEAASDTHDYHIEVSFCELYNEQIIDLLSTNKTPVGGLKLLETEKDRISIQRITLHRPKTAAEVMDLVMQGNERRATSATHANDESSRSHSILQVNVGRIAKGTQVDMAKQTVRQCVNSATLSIIDLAGSERASASQNSGDRQREGRNINKSLLALSGCLKALCLPAVQGKAPFVPYRDSKLTRMLKFSLGGNCRTVMIVCVSPSSKHIEETHNTLQWADTAKNVKTKVSQNTQGVNVRVQQYLDKIAYLQQRISDLEAERAAGPKYAEDPAMLAKRTRDQKELQQALDGLDAEVDTHTETIDAGAEKRALWDVSELTAASLNRRILQLQTEVDTRSAALVQRDLEYLQGRIKDEETNFRNNRIVHGVVHKEMKSTSTIEKHIYNISSRSFEFLPDGDREHMKVALEHKRKVVDNQVYAAREKGYRRMIGEHVDKDAIACLHIHSQKETLLQMAEAMEATGGPAAQFAEKLRTQADQAQTTLDVLHGHLAPITRALPPAVKFDNLQDFGLILPPPTPYNRSSMPPLSAPTMPMSPLASPSPPSMPSDLGRPQRMRMSTSGLPRASPPAASSSRKRSLLGPPAHGGSKLSPSSASVSREEVGFALPQPPAKHKSVSRLQGGLAPKIAPSPRKRVSASPAKRRLAAPVKSALAAAGQPRLGPAKTARWKGDDSITEEKTMSDAVIMSSPDFSSANDSGSGDWDDVDEAEADDEVSPDAGARALPAPTQSRIGLPARRVSTAPAASARPMLPPPIPSLSNSNSGGNDWKAARQRNLQVMSGLGTVSEEGNTSRSSVRLSPLAESRHNHTVPPSASSSKFASSSRLLKPTASSAARNASMGDLSLMSVASNSRLSRRDSSIGPAISRPLRRSIAPNPYGPKPEPHSSPSTDGSAPSPVSNRQSALSGGAKRASMNPFAPPPPPHTSSIRAPAPAPAPGGSLRSRASMANLSLNGIGRPPVGPGDTSMSSLMPRASMSNLRQSMAGSNDTRRWR